MFIDEKLADKRVDGDDNLVNLVLNIASRKTIPVPVPAENEPPVEETDSERELAPVDVVGIVKPHYDGRHNGGHNVDMELRHAAGLLAQTDTIANVADVLGISKNTVAMAKHGASVHGRENTELKDRLDKDLSKVRDKALERLLSSLNLLDDDKMKKCNAKDIASISASMSKVVSGTLPKDAEQNVRAQLIVYAPTQINETRYDRVEI